MREQSTTNNIFQPKHVRGGETKVMKAMKKSILTFLAFALVFTMAMPAFAANVATGAQYSDVENADVADAVKVLSSLAVLQGYPDGTFKPDNSITRAEFSAVVVRLLGYEKAAQAAVGKTPFKDEVLPWASGYVNIAVQQNLLNGYPDGTFRANQPVTQAEALTILVRALGYKALADKQGQWPYNYIVMADSIGLTEDLDGVVANQPANRGFVALASEAALTVPKAIASGFTINGEVNYVVSGTQGTKEQTILANDLKFVSQKAIVTAIPRIDSKLDDDEIKISYTDADDKNVTKTVTVPAGFDFELAFGTETTFYLDNSEVVYAKAGDVLYDAVNTKNIADNKVKLVDADKSYEFADKVTVYIDGKAKDIDDLTALDYEYGKVALDKSDDIRFIEVYSFPNYLVVEETKDNVVYSYGETLNVEKYTIVKDGKTVKVEDLQEGDIFYYNTTAKFAEVYNNTVTNKITHVFDKEIRVDGEDYDYQNTLYLDGDDLKVLGADEAKAMQEEGEVTIFLDRLGNMVFISGDLGKVATSSMYAVLKSNVAQYQEKLRDFASVEVVKPDGKSETLVADSKTKFIIDLNGTEKDLTIFPSTLTGAGVPGFEKTDIVKVTVNDEGKLTKVEYIGNTPVVEFKTTATYASGKKLQGSAVVYLVDGDKYKVFDWADAEEYFSVVKEGTVYFDANDRVVAMHVTKSDAADSYKAYNAFVSDVKKLTDSKQQIKVVIDKTSYEFVVDATPVVTAKTVIELKVNDKMDTAKVASTSLTPDTGVVNKEANLRDNTLSVKVGVVDKTYEFTNTAYIYDVTNKKAIDLRTVKANDHVDLYLVPNTTRFVSIALVTPAGTTPPKTTTGIVKVVNADPNAGELAFVVDKTTTYFVDTKTVLTNAKGEVLLIGNAVLTDATNKLVDGDQVEVTAKEGVAVTIKRVKTASELGEEAALATAKVNLAAAVSSVNSLAEADYTTASWTTFKVARTAALAMPETTSTEVNAKITAINAAKTGLVFAGKADLNTAKANVASAKANQANYTAASFTLFSADLITAEALPETTNTEVVAKTNALNAAMAKLVKSDALKAKELLEAATLSAQQVAFDTDTATTVTAVQGAVKTYLETLITNATVVATWTDAPAEITGVVGAADYNFTVVITGADTSSATSSLKINVEIN